MIEIDGSAGGGQLLRTALSVSAISDQPFRMDRIRAGRPDPGLRPQHLAALSAVGAIAGAEIEGAAVGSSSVEFRPSGVTPGRYSVDVGTAGSVSLVFDAVLPLAAAIDGRLSLEATGGTDVRWAPTLDYLRRVKLPLLRRQGLVAAVDPERRGFYPVGGGRARLTVGPSTIEPLAVDADDGAVAARTYSVASEDLAEREVAERQGTMVTDGLQDLGVDVIERTLEYVTAPCTGSVLTVRLDGRGAPSGFDALGARGKRAEAVGEEVLDDVERWLQGEAPIDVHMADQLLVFLAIAGGRMAVPTVTDHVESNRHVLATFGYELAIEPGSPPVVSS